MLDLILHYHHTGAMALNDQAKPTPSSLSGNVPDDEVWEVMSHPVVSFNDDIAGAGTVADLGVVPVIDGTNLQDYLYYLYAQDANFNPPPPFVAGPRMPLMAEGLLAALDAQKHGQPTVRVMEMASSLKAATSITIVATALTALTLDFDIKLYGKKWKRDEFDRLFGGAALSGTYAVTRPVEGNSIAFPVATLPITFSGWASLPGGKAQTTGLKWMPRVNFGINANATTRGKPYQFSYEAGTTANVQNEQQEQYWPYSILQSSGDKVLAVKGFGARSRYAAALTGTTLKYASLYNENDVIFNSHPSDQFLVTDNDNSRIFGWQAPVGPAGYYRANPRFGFYVFNSVAYIQAEDDGTGTVAAGDILTMVDGYQVENYGQIPGLVLVRGGQVVKQNPASATISAG